MKKRILLLITISAMLNMISCKKDVEPDIDNQLNNNFRILKVEQINKIVTPPFNPDGERNMTIEYESQEDSSVVGKLYFTGSPDFYVTIPIWKEINGTFSMLPPDPTLFSAFSFLPEIGSFICGINKSYIRIDKNNIKSLRYECRTCPWGITGQVRNKEYNYVGERLNEVIDVLDYHLYPPNIIGDYVGKATIISWNGNLISKYKTEDYLGYSQFNCCIDSSGVINLFDKGREFDIQLMYDVTPENMPKELIRKVNQVLSGVIRGPFENYVFNWQIDFLNPGNNFLKEYVEDYYKDYVDRLQSTDKTILADWMWSFAHPSFNVLPDQDKIISSKRITGRKIVDIIDDQPVYQDIDSTATFPYVFDPVAKTLEIAGLKIWYEVVE
jgi:hypothetical protein